MEPKAEGSFLKQLQNKQKNLQRKLEKIEAKEKRPLTELSEDEKELLRNKSTVLTLKQEYDRILASYNSSKEAPQPVVSAPIETHIEIRQVDSTSEILSLWLSLHYIAQPGVKEAFLGQGFDLQDYEEVLQIRKTILGEPGMEVKDILQRAENTLHKFRKPEDDEELRRRDVLVRVQGWCLAQSVPEPVKSLSVDTPREQHQILTAALESAVVEVEEVAPEPLKEPVVESAKPGELKEEQEEKIQEPVGSWAREGDDEEPPKDEEEKKEGDADEGFTEVKTKTRHKPQGEQHRGDMNRRRSWRRGDHQGRGRRPFGPPQQREFS